ncbi:MAG: 23S rRNA (adenine(2503)-C(2))-methyltransferase RlmN [bacterium]|nr:23S rRNA (adenine(2503)-C(2))-methyltransferase RlmN [bacterium]
MRFYYLKGYTYNELKNLIKNILTKDNSNLNENFFDYRVDQVFNWIYKKYEENIDNFSNLSKNFREFLKNSFKMNSLEIYDIKFSKYNDSIKFLFKTEDNEYIESVLMKHPDRYTVCLSTQVGCNVRCVFCASGINGVKRNLELSEIIDQFFLIQKFIYLKENKRVSNIVYMGMGEPLFNYENLIKSLEIFTHDKAFNISNRNITVSTSGVVDKIYSLADEKFKVKLAISLHSPFEHKRQKLIPLAKKYTIQQILKAVEYYFLKTKKRITIEYILLKGITDTPEDAKELVNLLKNYNFKVFINLIPYNSIGEVYLDSILLEQSDMESINRFYEYVKKYFEVNVRWSLGRDINAACGQLRRNILNTRVN